MRSPLAQTSRLTVASIAIPAARRTASLKPRPVAGKGEQKEELPFLNAMSRLKSTRTQNYKPQDEFKEQILESKATLNVTGGPQKPNRADPLKESLLSAKGSLRHSDANRAKPVFEAKPGLRGHADSLPPKPSFLHSEPKAPFKHPEPTIPKPLFPHPAAINTPHRNSASPPAHAVYPLPPRQHAESSPPRPTFLPADHLKSKATAFGSTITPKPSVFEQKTTPTATLKPSVFEQKTTPTVTPKSSVFEQKTSAATTRTPTPATTTSTTPARVEAEKKASSLADRFNPSLSNLLSRGPPTASSGNTFKASRSQDASPTPFKSNDGVNENEAGGAPLTHVCDFEGSDLDWEEGSSLMFV